MGMFRMGDTLNEYTADELDWAAVDRGGIVYAIGLSFTFRPDDCGEAHGYRGVWRNAQGMGNHGQLCLEAVNPSSRQAKLLEDGRRTYWERKRTKTGKTWDEIAASGGVLQEWQPGESPVPGVRISGDWKVVVQGCGFPVWGDVVRVKPCSERAREVVRLARQQAVAEVAPVDAGLIRRAVIAGERHPKGYDANILASACLIPLRVWQGQLPRSNAAIGRWMERNQITAPIGGINDMLAARDIALAM